MSQDFAKHRQPASKARPKSARAAVSRHIETPDTHWRWYFSGVGTGFLIIAIAYIGMIRLDTELDQATSANSTAEDGTPLRPAIDFSFYEELANAEVNVNVDSTPGVKNSGNVQGRQQTASSSQEQDTNRYLLQAGSFQQREEAEKRKVEILMMNLNVNVTPGQVSGRIWHRVMVGPFNGRSSANDAINMLSENNIETRLMIQRD